MRLRVGAGETVHVLWTCLIERQERRPDARAHLELQRQRPSVGRLHAELVKRIAAAPLLQEPEDILQLLVGEREVKVGCTWRGAAWSAGATGPRALPLAMHLVGLTCPDGVRGAWHVHLARWVTVQDAGSLGDEVT